MATLLGEVDQNASTRKPSASVSRTKSETSRKVRILSPPLSDSKPSRSKLTADNDGYLADTPPAEARLMDDNNDDGGYIRGLDDDEVPPLNSSLPSSPPTKTVERKSLLPNRMEEDDVDEVMEVAPAQGHSNVNATSVNISASRPVQVAKKAAYPSPRSSSPTRPPPEIVDASAWTDVTTKLNVVSSSPVTDAAAHGKIQPQDALEDDGSLRMFWLDYTEINGSLCLFGKVKHRKNGKYVSCFMKVDNILRKLFFLPREYRQRQYHVPALWSLTDSWTGNGRETTVDVEMKDVYEEVDELMSKMRVGMHKIKPCSRKYAFELPDVPKKADYLKLLYPYDSEFRVGS